MRGILYIVLVSFLAIKNAFGAIVVLDFNSPLLTNQYFLDGQQIISEPVDVTTSGASGDVDIISPPSSYTAGPNNTTPYLHSSIYSSVFINTIEPSHYFDLLSLDIGEYSSYSSTTSVGISGLKIDGSILSTTVNLDGAFDGVVGIDDFQTIIFDNSWTQLIQVSFDDSDYSLDNIEIDLVTVPLPGALLLFLSGIGLLGCKSIRSRNK